MFQKVIILLKNLNNSMIIRGKKTLVSILLFVDIVTVRVITLPSALLVPSKNLVSNTFKAMKAMTIIAILKIWNSCEKDKQSRQ